MTLPEKGSHIFFIGLGGIGMSGLAQFFEHCGYKVSGSDRDLTTPAQQVLFKKLNSHGIEVFQQDGSGIKEDIKLIIYSSAIEDDNPDFAAAGDTPRMHRSNAMAALLNQSGLKQIAVAGSCGKTSVTAWIGSALEAAGNNPLVINGGYINEFITAERPGNFKPGDGYAVYEADESDGSLVNFDPSVSLLLNLGKDHYEKDELEVFFRKFLSNAKDHVVVNTSLAYLNEGYAETFDPSGHDSELSIDSYSHDENGVCFESPYGSFKTRQWGRHSAENALAVIAVMKALDFDRETITKSIYQFTGVMRRFDFKGTNKNGNRVYDDYAHNPQKIASCISALQELSTRKIHAIFQPHGYGPLGFMRDELKEELLKTLGEDTIFYMLPVFYAGGTTSFKPPSDEVIEDYQNSGMKAIYITREETEKLVEEKSAEDFIILGARDPSLITWTSELAGAQ